MKDNFIDKTAIKKMKELLGEEFPAVLSDFLADVEIYIEEIGEALRVGNQEQISEIAHKLKSSAGQFGFPHIQNIAKFMEHKEMEENVLLLQELKIAYKEVVNFLKV